MDILMILMASLGIGYLTIGTGSIAKDALSKMSDEARRDPVDTSKLKSFLIAIALYVIVYFCLNVCAMIIALTIGETDMSDSERSTIICFNLLLSLPITWFILKKNSKVKRSWLLTNNINANNAVIP